MNRPRPNPRRLNRPIHQKHTGLSPNGTSSHFQQPSIADTVLASSYGLQPLVLLLVWPTSPVPCLVGTILHLLSLVVVVVVGWVVVVVVGLVVVVVVGLVVVVVVD